MKKEDYYNSENISQSKLKKLISHPKNYNNKSTLKGPSLTLGSLVDDLLFDKECFNEKYSINNVIKLPENIKIIFDKYYENRKELSNFELDYDIINSLAINEKYRLTNSDKIRISKIKEYEKYYTNLVNNHSKVVISQDMLDIANRILESLQNSKFTKDIVNNIDSNLTQIEIYWELEQYKLFKLKSLIDWIEIDEINKTIQPWDLKTTGEYTSNFVKSIFKYRYDFQAAFYTFALQHKFKDYKILPFRFLVESTKNQGSPLIYELTESVLNIGAFGGTLNNIYYKGFINCLDELVFHTKTNQWNYTRDEYITNGVIKV